MCMCVCVCVCASVRVCMHLSVYVGVCGWVDTLCVSMRACMCDLCIHVSACVHV